jgi:hypothetical protein
MKMRTTERKFLLLRLEKPPLKVVKNLLPMRNDQQTQRYLSFACNSY